MAGSQRCSDCESYEREGHNYCRMCGFHFKTGRVRNVRVAVAYNTSEKYCGYCGGAKDDCDCRSDENK